MRLTETDLVVLKHLLGWADQTFPSGALNVRAEDIARQAGLHRNTVARRIRALQEGGVIEGFLFEPHPQSLGLVRAGTMFYGLPALDTASLTQLLASFPNVSMAALHADSCFLHSWHDSADGVDEDMESICQALGAQGWAPGFRLDGGGEARLSPLDARLLLALRRGFTRSVAEAAGSAGTTRRTAARHMGRFADGKVGSLMPMFRPGNIEGLLLAVYTPRSWDARTYGRLAKAFPDRIMGPMAPPTSPMAMVPVASIEEATHKRSEAQWPDLDMAFMRDVIFPKACDAWIAKRVQNAPVGVTKA